MDEENISFEELLNNSMNQNQRLDKITEGTVISVNQNNEVFVDLNYKADGIIPRGEYSFDENVNPSKELKPGDKIKVEVLKLNDGQGNVLLSYKKLRDQERKKEFWDNVEVGKEYEGVVSSICSYGAFIDINGIQGLLHISEISWNRDVKVQDILKQGQTIKVIIKELDRENKRIKLSYADKGVNPWDNLKINVGDVVKVKIRKFMPFGAFAQIAEGVDGLIHISQISTQRIAKPDEKLKIGEDVNAKVLNIDLENKKIELSIKELEGTSNEYSSLEEKNN